MIWQCFVLCKPLYSVMHLKAGHVNDRGNGVMGYRGVCVGGGDIHLDSDEV